MYKTIASFNGDVKIYDGKLGYANLLKLTGEMPKNIEHIEVLHNDRGFGDFYSWSNKIVENNFGSNFKEGFPIVNFSKDGSEVEVITAYGELENGVSVLFDKDSLEWVVEFAEGGEISDHEETYKKWKSLVNMSKSELENFYNSEEGKEAGLRLDSVIDCTVIATIPKTLLVSKIGAFPNETMERVDQCLMIAMAIGRPVQPLNNAEPRNPLSFGNDPGGPEMQAKSEPESPANR